ncbi:MAG: hypoxanthine phosphoribosyltransferase [Bacteroidales bacterium]|nr:hypoxanthine phosphoribosyltransferase [Bacteroidales bacterium]
MDNSIVLNGMRFFPYLRKEQIDREVERVAREIRLDVEGKNPLFIVVLTGAFMFAADLLRQVGINESQIEFVRYSSYEGGTSTTGKVKQLMGLREDVKGRDLVIIEDIVDTGLTAEKMVADLKSKEPASVKFATLLYKPESSRTGFRPDYAAFVIPPKFILGYGLDLDGKGRNLADIYACED